MKIYAVSLSGDICRENSPTSQQTAALSVPLNSVFEYDAKTESRSPRLQLRCPATVSAEAQLHWPPAPGLATPSAGPGGPATGTDARETPATADPGNLRESSPQELVAPHPQRTSPVPIGCTRDGAESPGPLGQGRTPCGRRQRMARQTRDVAAFPEAEEA